jgi:membrane protease YdiL (CAAX protease family)
MRAFLAFILLMAVALVAGALLAYPVHELGQALDADWPFHRVASRVAMLMLLVGFLLLIRRLRLAARASLGYGLQRPRWIRLAGLSLLIGAVSMLPVVGILLALGIRAPLPDVDAAAVMGVLLSGLLSGIVVAFVEETFLRGAMFTAVERESGATAAIGLTAFVYAALHFLNRVKIPAEQVNAGSGFDLLAGTLDTLAHPVAIVDSFLALFAVGVLLAVVRARTGNIAACVGLHAGWVWVIAITRELTRRDPTSEWAYLVGNYDGIVGYFVFGWTVLMVAAAHFILRPAAPLAGRL